MVELDQLVPSIGKNQKDMIVKELRSGGQSTQRRKTKYSRERVWKHFFTSKFKRVVGLMVTDIQTCKSGEACTMSRLTCQRPPMALQDPPIQMVLDHNNPLSQEAGVL